MPPAIRAGQKATVHIEISPRALARPTGPTSAGGELKFGVDADKPLTVQLMARSNIEVVGDDRTDIAMPGPDDPPASLFFDVRGTTAGPGELWVLIRQGHPSLLVLSLAPEVLPRRSAARSETRGLLRADSDMPAVAPRGWALPTLRINERSTGVGVVFEYDLDLLQRGTYQYSSPLIKGDQDAFVRRLYDDLEQRWIGNRGDADAFLGDVRGYGGTLFDQLLPPELQRILWKHRKELLNIRVLSTEPFVPWELVHLKNPDTGRLPRETSFLAQMGLVRWLINKPGAAEGLRARPGKVRYLIPDYPDARYRLTEPAIERAFLERTFAATKVDPHASPVGALLRRRGAVDVLHFAGHGAASGGNMSDAKLLLEGRLDDSAAYVEEFLLATTVRQEANLARSDEPVRPLVFLNACQAGRLGQQLTSIGGFADSFLAAGAGAFVSSLWNVGDEPAATFGITLYERLKAGDTIATAAVKARKQARDAGDATWLAYVVYAHPDARLA
jgi:CHAT domain